MDYEKKYKEALENARQEYNTTENVERKQWLEELFPELKESEDEKVREYLIRYIDNTMKDSELKSKLLAWLEKQKNCEYIKKDWLEHIKQSWYKEGFIDGKYTPKEWSINDAATLNGLIDFLENGTAKLQHDLTLYANWLKKQFSPNEKQGEQNLNWGEEDECYMRECIGAIATKDGWSFEEKRKTKHWLKALKDRYTWKPSDEQMESLEQFISEYKDIDDSNRAYPISHIIESLYNDLKKLKGE